MCFQVIRLEKNLYGIAYFWQPVFMNLPAKLHEKICQTQHIGQLFEDSLHSLVYCSSENQVPYFLLDKVWDIRIFLINIKHPWINFEEMPSVWYQSTHKMATECNVAKITTLTHDTHVTEACVKRTVVLTRWWSSWGWGW